MKTNITAKNMVITPGISNRIFKKTATMERYLKADTEMFVRLRKERDERICEITVPMKGVTLRAESASKDNLFMAIDKCLAKLERQILRHRTKLEKRIRTSELEPVVAEAPVYEEQNYDIVRVKKFAVKPMGVEDAITQMELLGHSFFVFVDIETERTNVLYLRKDGDLGLMVPEA